MLRRFTPILLPLLLSVALIGADQCGSSGDDDDTQTPMPTPMPTITPAPTPPPLTEGACRTGDDCDNGASCYAPGQSIGCGNCFENPDQCESNSDCETGYVCGWDNSPCQCTGPSRICVAECTETSCPEGEACGADGLCEIIHCRDGNITCPDLTTCTADASGNGCLRWSCDDDATCGGANVCVNGKCYDSFGFCSYPPP